MGREATPRRAPKERETAVRRRGRPPIPDLRGKLLASAIELFSERGFAEVSTGEVAERAEVGKGSLYREFGSKEQLYAEAIIEEFRRLRTAIEHDLAAELSAVQRLALVVRRTSEFFWDKGEFFTLLRDPRALPSSQLKDFRAERGQLSIILAQVLRDGAERGVMGSDVKFASAAEAILGMIRALRRHRQSGEAVEAAIATVMRLASEGLVTKGGDSTRF